MVERALLLLESALVVGEGGLDGLRDVRDGEEGGNGYVCEV